MTHIPGTEIVSRKPRISNDKNLIIKNTEIKTISVYNINNLKTKKGDSIGNSDESRWYNKAGTWVLYGLIGSFIVFGILSLVNIRFLYLIMAGPVVGLIVWYLKKYFGSIFKNSDLSIKRNS